ncbi:hypothetical protein OHW85_23810, partial [Acinetobacter baumannii]|nr:hypothetical protein [Acinetobacter baumannii]
FMGLPVADYDSINKLHLKLHGYIECLLESELCTQSEHDLLKASLDEIHGSKSKPKHSFSSSDPDDFSFTKEELQDPNLNILDLNILDGKC